jgi:hypothetical protein
MKYFSGGTRVGSTRVYPKEDTMSQHRVVAYLKVKVEFVVDEKVDADDILNGVLVDTFKEDGDSIHSEIESFEIYSDEKVGG